MNVPHASRMAGMASAAGLGNLAGAAIWAGAAILGTSGGFKS